MQKNTTGKGLALVAGILATGGALAILLQDAIRSGDWTLEHGLIPVLMAVQILTGHLFVTAARQKKVLPAIGFLIVATVATWGVLDTSVGKQAAIQAEATAKAEDANGRLSDKTAELVKARQRLADAERMIDIETGNKGCRSNCKDWKTRAAEVRSHITVLESELARLGPPQPVDAKSENMAILVAALTGHDKAAIKHVLATVRPFTYALIFELAALVSFGFAFGHGNRQALAKPDEIRATVGTVANDDTAPVPPKGGQRRTVATRAAAEADVVRLIARGEVLPSQDTLACRWGAHPGTVSKWLSDFERRGIISRKVEGRCKRVRGAA